MSLEDRVGVLEDAMLEIQTLIKILKPIALLLAASIGVDLVDFI